MSERPDESKSAAAALTAFETHVTPSLFAAGASGPGALRSAISRLRETLDRFEAVLPGAAGGATCAGEPANGHAASAADTGDELDSLGRNQKARLRELVLLEALADAARPVPIQHLMQALDKRGFDSGQAAVVSQLHRMKTLGTIEVAGSGMYAATPAGREHLHKLKTGLGALLRP
jgi:hypothetical protein